MTNRSDTTLLNESARRYRIKRRQRVLMVMRETKAMLPGGAGFGECLGSEDGM